MSTDRVPMTQPAYDRLKAELDRMENEEMPKIAERIALAREDGDLKENAEYHGARESQGMLQAKINLQKDKLHRALIIDPSKVPRDEVAFGATVTVLDLDYDDEEEFTLVGLGDEDYDCGKILCTGPIGTGLLGKKIGEKVEIPIPKGTAKFKILKIEYNFDE